MEWIDNRFSAEFCFMWMDMISLTQRTSECVLFCTYLGGVNLRHARSFNYSVQCKDEDIVVMSWQNQIITGCSDQFVKRLPDGGNLKVCFLSIWKRSTLSRSCKGILVDPRRNSLGIYNHLGLLTERVWYCVLPCLLLVLLVDQLNM